jgi:hypothetical protein
MDRFKGFDINKVTLKNYESLLPDSLVKQVRPFLPPTGSFKVSHLRRYLRVIEAYEQEDPFAHLSIANQIRIAYRSMEPATLCTKFDRADIETRRRLRCVAEYLIRQDEFVKLKDVDDKLVKQKSLNGKLVVVYQPLPKMLDVLRKQGLDKLDSKQP